MTHPTIPAAEHRHIGGSVGGPGENSAECACGTVFSGFDTQHEVHRLLQEHIRDEQETKRADQLAVGDWVSLLADHGDPWETRRNTKVAAVFPYTDEVENDRVLLVTRTSDTARPWTNRLLADQPVRVLTADELAAIREQAERAQQIADIRAFADFLEQNRWAPIENLHMQWSPNPNRDIWNSGGEGVAQVRRMAEQMGAEAVQSDAMTKVIRHFGPVEYSLIAWHKDGRPVEAPVEDERCPACGESLREIQSGRLGHIPGESCAPAEVDDPTGLTYSRVDDDPQVIRPHSPRVPLHTGAVVDGGVLVDETPAEPRSPLVHLGLRGRARCGVSSTGVLAVADADSMTIHPVEVTCQVCRELANLAPAEQIRKALDEAVQLTAAGLTPEADASRGPLAGMTPVVTYFSFGYGQTDPGTGAGLVDHYVTVVAPTYDECREAMFASRYENRWSFDYLAGRPSTTEAVSQWTEHEVIIAPGTDLDAAEKALTAAADLLQIDGAR